MSRRLSMGRGDEFTRHGFILVYGREWDIRVFTGASLSIALDRAKVFRTRRGAISALRFWKMTFEFPLTPAEISNFRVMPVRLHLDIAGGYERAAKNEP